MYIHAWMLVAIGSITFWQWSEAEVKHTKLCSGKPRIWLWMQPSCLKRFFPYGLEYKRYMSLLTVNAPLKYSCSSFFPVTVTVVEQSDFYFAKLQGTQEVKTTRSILIIWMIYNLLNRHTMQSLEWNWRWQYCKHVES